MHFFRFNGCVLPLAFLLAAGCSGADGDGGKVEVHPTSGRIVFNGKPVADAVVTFAPKGDQPAAIGRTDASGTYKLMTYAPEDGAAVGEYKVLVAQQRAVDPVAAAPRLPGHDAPGIPADSRPGAHAQAARRKTSESDIPESYANAETSILTATVKEGENKFDFPLIP